MKEERRQIQSEIKAYNDMLKNKNTSKFEKSGYKELINELKNEKLLYDSAINRYENVLKDNRKNKKNKLPINDIKNIDHHEKPRDKEKKDINDYEVETQKAFNGMIINKTIKLHVRDFDIFLEDEKYINFIKNDVLKYLNEHRSLQLVINYKTEYKSEGSYRPILYYAASRVNILNTNEENIKNNIINSMRKIHMDIEAAKTIEGSDSIIHYNAVIAINYLMFKYTPLYGRSYIELPEFIQNKKACINIKNEDNKCFLWSVLAHIFPVEKNANRLSNYIKHEQYINMKNIEYPIAINDIKKIEKLNPNLSINVFSYEEKNKNNTYIKNDYDFNFNFDGFISLSLIKQKTIFERMTFNENINIDVINKIINNVDMINNEEWNELKQIQSIKNNIKKNILKVKYIKSKYGYGRVYPIKSISLCSVRRELRHTLDHYNNEIKYIDVDMVNAHPVILNEICKIHNINLFYLNEYILNRDDIINNISIIFNTSKDIIKTLFIIILYNGSINNYLTKNNIEIKQNTNEYIYLLNFQDDIKKIGALIYENNKNKINEIKNYQKHKKYENDTGLILSIYMQDRERQLLEILYNYCVNNNYIINNDCVLCFDGIMLNSKNIINKNELIINLENEIIKYTKMNIKLKIKDMNEYINIGDVVYTSQENKINIKKEKKINEKEKNKYSFFPLSISENETAEHKIDLLYFENEQGNNHYCLIKNLSALLNKGYEKHGYYCRLCLNRFESEILLNEHKKNCVNFDFQTCIMPEKGSVIKFKDYSALQIDHFNIIADFEAYTEKCNIQAGDTTKIYQQHKPVSYSLIVNCISNIKLNKYYMYSGDNCMEHFFYDLLDAKRYIEEQLNNVALIKMTEEQKKKYNDAKNCDLCGSLFNAKNKKQRDHDHYTGDFRYTLCYICNMKIQIPKHVNIYFHNSKNYDTHFIFKELHELFKIQNDYLITVLGHNTEKYLTFTIKEKERLNDEGFLLSMRFLDSNNVFMNPLNELANNLKESQKITLYTHLRENYNYTDEQIKLISSKGIFPYDWFDNIDKLNNTTLPKHKNFYNRLKSCNITKEEYKHALKIWNEFKFETFNEYLKIYMLIDTLLLTDVINSFRNKFFNLYKLEASNYISCPSFSWSLMLKMSKIEIERLTDVNMYNDFDLGIRGGISSVLGDREIICNNKYLKNYDSKKESIYVSYLDVNNLYGYIMRNEKFPYKNFKYEEDLSIFTSEFIKSYNFDGEKGFYFICDLEYPKELHKEHVNYPLAAEKMEVQNKHLSNYQNNLKKKLNIINSKTKKLILSYLPKNNYGVDGKTLQFYLNHGLILKNVNRVISYDQTDFLKNYVDDFTKMRTEAKKNKDKENDELSKLFINSIFGKTMQNVRKQKKIEILTGEQKNRFNKLSSRNLIKKINIFNEETIAIEKVKTKVKLDQPVFIGQCILDRSKLYMYHLYYDIYKKKYGENIELIYSDTDSMVLKIKTDDLYKDMIDMKEIYDFNNMINPLFLNEDGELKLNYSDNNFVLGKFKDETKGLPIKKFIVLRSKMYAIEYEEKTEVKTVRKAKGMSKNIVKKYLYNQYSNALHKNDIRQDYMHTLRSTNHQIQGLNMFKVSLSPYDDKRYYANNIKSYPIGMYNPI